MLFKFWLRTNEFLPFSEPPVFPRFVPPAENPLVVVGAWRDRRWVDWPGKWFFMKFDELRGALLEVPLPIRELNPLEPAEELPLPEDRLVPWCCGENERIEFALPPADLPPDDLLPEEIPPRRLLPLPGELCAEPPLRNLLLPPPFPLRDPPLLLFPPRLLFGAALDHSAVSKNMASIAAQSPNLARMGVSPSPKKTHCHRTRNHTS